MSVGKMCQPGEYYEIWTRVGAQTWQPLADGPTNRIWVTLESAIMEAREQVGAETLLGQIWAVSVQKVTSTEEVHYFAGGRQTPDASGSKGGE